MTTKEGSTKIVNLTIPGAGVLVLRYGYISHIVKMQYSFLLFYSWTWIRKIKNMYIIIITTEGSTKIVNFMTPGTRVSCARACVGGTRVGGLKLCMH